MTSSDDHPLARNVSYKKVSAPEFEVSFVIPCYNVEKYVARCLDSVLVQEGALFEIVCVDDGSTDETPCILDSYSKFHNIIRVVSKQNSGLADARNRGVQEAKGNFIAFVDSDDFVAPHYLETLWDAHIQSGADFVVTKGFPVSESAVPQLQKYWKKTANRYWNLVPSSEMGTMLLSEELSCSAWGKLIRREVCLAHPFESGRFYEDVEVVPFYFSSARKCAATEQPQYGYVMRAGSITHSSIPTDKQLDDFVEAYTAMEETTQILFACSLDSIAYHRMLSACRFHSLAAKREDCKSSDLEESLISKAEDALKRASRYGLSRIMRYRFLLLKKCPRIYDVLFSIYDRTVKGRRFI